MPQTRQSSHRVAKPTRSAVVLISRKEQDDALKCLQRYMKTEEKLKLQHPVWPSDEVLHPRDEILFRMWSGRSQSSLIGTDDFLASLFREMPLVPPPPPPSAQSPLWHAIRSHLNRDHTARYVLEHNLVVYSANVTKSVHIGIKLVSSDSPFYHARINSDSTPGSPGYCEKLCKP